MWVMTMDASKKFKIITECQLNGVSNTCKKYGISRTLYYRWLNRYKTQGMDGLNNKVKNFVPINKTSKDIESKILKLIKAYPAYGPQAIKYLLDEIGHHLSESAVYNVMKRHNLTNRTNRLRYAHKKIRKVAESLPLLKELNSGECWLFWITNLGDYKDQANYEYTMFDCKSKIACTRVYDDISMMYFEDLLTAVAMPIAQTLKLNTKYLCLFTDCHLIKKYKSKLETELLEVLRTSGFNAKLHVLKDSTELNHFKNLQSTYTDGCISYLLPLMQNNTTISDIKVKFQAYIRNYNIQNKQSYDIGEFSPINYHNKTANTNMILPIWAYLDREY